METPTDAPKSLDEWGSTERRSKERARRFGEIIELAKQGKTDAEICTALGCSKGSVQATRRAAGLFRRLGRRAQQNAAA